VNSRTTDSQQSVEERLWCSFLILLLFPDNPVKFIAMKIIFKILITALALFLAEKLIPGINVDSFYTALIVALLLGVINITLKPILLLLTFPINFLTLGLFTFVINGLLLWFVASFVDGFVILGFTDAFLGALVISVIKWLGDKLISED
jgi:putative membrane protein